MENQMVDQNAIKQLETLIQKACINFVNTHGCDIDYVCVDVRTWANYRTEVSIKRQDIA
jgi:hypothetical protein